MGVIFLNRRNVEMKKIDDLDTYIKEKNGLLNSDVECSTDEILERIDQKVDKMVDDYFENQVK
jgi:DNA helicase TIP49 (TBP-interacting protein)